MDARGRGTIPGELVWSGAPLGPRVRYFAQLSDPPVRFTVNTRGEWNLDVTEIMDWPEEQNHEAVMAARHTLILPYRSERIAYGLLGPVEAEELAR